MSVIARSRPLQVRLDLTFPDRSTVTTADGSEIPCRRVILNLDRAEAPTLMLEIPAAEFGTIEIVREGD